MRTSVLQTSGDFADGNLAALNEPVWQGPDPWVMFQNRLSVFSQLEVKVMHGVLWLQSARTPCAARMQAYARSLSDAPELADITAVDLSGAQTWTSTAAGLSLKTDVAALNGDLNWPPAACLRPSIEPQSLHVGLRQEPAGHVRAGRHHGGRPERACGHGRRRRRGGRPREEAQAPLRGPPAHEQHRRRHQAGRPAPGAPLPGDEAAPTLAVLRMQRVPAFAPSICVCQMETTPPSCAC